MQTLRVIPHRALERSIRCSFADAMMRRGIPAMGLFYRERLDPQRLADALGRVLSDFEVYAGRFVVDGDAVSVVPSQAGVTLEVVHTEQRVQDLMDAVGAEQYERIAPALSPRLQARGAHALMAARVTLTPDGSVLAFSWNHAIGDLHSTILLLRAWAQQCRGLPSEAPFDVEDRQAYLDERVPAAGGPACLRVFSARELFKSVRYVATRKTRVDLQFTGAELDALRAAVGGSSVSLVDALAAHVFCVLRRLQSPAQLSRMITVINCRKRLGLPLGILGNVVDVVRRNIEPTEGTAQIARGLRVEIDAFATRHLSHHATAAFHRSPRSRLERLRVLPALLDPEGGSFIVSSVVNAGLYDLQFADARPALFSTLMRFPMPFMAIIVEAPGGDGLTVSMHLPKALAGRLLSPEGTSLLRAYPMAPAPRATRTFAQPSPV